MSIKLKIKSKSLAAEAAIIRTEERKLQKQIAFHLKQDGMVWQTRDENGNIRMTPFAKAHSAHWSVYSHRIRDVRDEARATFLARAYLHGLAYDEVEQNVKNEEKLMRFILPRTLTLVKKYGDMRTKLEDLTDWVWIST